MNHLIILTITFLKILQISSLGVSFVSWNVRDNKKSYPSDVIFKLLNLGNPGPLPDVFAISFQENCLNCKYSHLKRLAEPFIEVLKYETLENYKLLSIHATRKSQYCESIYCSSFGSMHGTTFIMILLKSKLQVSGEFSEKVNDCSDQFINNKEKGVVVIGFNLNNVKYCFGGLHLDDKNVKYRQSCFGKILDKITGNCDVMFFGGDFNTRPQNKNYKIPKEFQGGQNISFLKEMKETDELIGRKPFSGGLNFLDHLSSQKLVQFIEPFNKFPDFKPTYSMESSLNCKDFPICYKSGRYPSWTDRIIYTPKSRVTCSEYDIIHHLAPFSDHLPVYVTCEVF